MKAVMYLVIISFFVIVASCEKEDYTLPTTVDFEFTMDSYHMEGNNKSGSSFDIDKGSILITATEFDGRRDQGGDYYFTSEFSTPVKAELHNQTMSQFISYDIPQGVYNRIELNLSLGDGNEDALCLEGKFRRGPMDDVSIRFEYAFQEQIRITAKNYQGNETVVLAQNEPVKARVIFDASYLFQLINMNMFQNAETFQIDGENVILINSEKNTDIFNLLVTRLDNSVRVVFE